MSEQRETANAEIYPAIPHVAGDIASDRAEEPRSFSRKFGSESQIFVKKINTYHAAAGDSAVHRVKCPVCTLTA
jgi:hypothetical protein